MSIEELYSTFVKEAGVAYAKYANLMACQDCKGAGHRLANGSFTVDNLNAHTEAYAWYGRHRALHDAAWRIKDILDANK